MKTKIVNLLLLLLFGIGMLGTSIILFVSIFIDKNYTYIIFSILFLVIFILILAKFIAGFSKKIIWGVVVDSYVSDMRGACSNSNDDSVNWFTGVAYVTPKGKTVVLQYSGARSKHPLKNGSIIAIRKFLWTHYIDPTVEPTGNIALNPIVLQANVNDPSYFRKIRNKQMLKWLIPNLIGILILIVVAIIIS